MKRGSELDTDLSQIWRAGRPADDAWEAQEVVVDAMNRARRLTRTFFWRDMRELAAVVLVGFVFGALAWYAPGPLPKVGAVLGTLGGVWAYLPLRRVRRRNARRSSFASSTVTAFEAEVEGLDDQIGLLDTVDVWYLRPLRWGGLAMVVSLAASLPIPWSSRVVAILALALVTWAIFAVVGRWILGLNRRASRHLGVQRAELAEMLTELREA